MTGEDKAIRRMLCDRTEENLSFSLRNKILLEVEKEAVKKKKRAYIRNIVWVSCVSLALTSGAVYILVAHIGFSLSVPSLQWSPDSKNMWIISVYLALIIVLLLVFDHFLRKAYERHKTGVS